MDRIIVSLLLVASATLLQGKPGYGPGEQEYGHVLVKDGGFMFYWLFYTQAQVTSFTDRPLVIWLQGGPGASSAGYGNFAELGPLHINGSARASSWANHVNLLFIDNPVGSGFSYVTNPSAYSTDNFQIGSDLVNFTRSFYRTFPDFSKTPLYIFCESYGGKMVVEFAKQLHAAIRSENLNIDFRGIALGDSWVYPMASVQNWSPYLYNTGLVDEVGQETVRVEAENIRTALSRGQYEEATNLWGHLEQTVSELTFGVDFYNILYKVSGFRKMKNGESIKNFVFRNQVFDATRDDDADIQALMDGPVRQALSIPNNISFGGQSGDVFDALWIDFMKPVSAVVTELLDTTELDVVVYSGQLDLIVATVGTVEWVNALLWSGQDAWGMAPRTDFVIDGIVEGYIKNLNHLYFYWIDRAGHMVPTDNPAAGVELLRRVTKYDI